MFGLEVSDGRFDGGAAFHPFPHSFGDRCQAAFINDDRLRALMIINPVAQVYRAFFYCMRSDQPAPMSQLRIQGVSVIGIAQ